MGSNRSDTVDIYLVKELGMKIQERVLENKLNNEHSCIEVPGQRPYVVQETKMPELGPINRRKL